MINLDHIKLFYSEKEKIFEQFILKEYLQYQILNIIFSSPFGSQLSFLGGTAIRLLYASSRFSEDLDFDNFGLEEKDFDHLSVHIQKELNKLGYEVEIKNVYKGAYRCVIKLPHILKELGFSSLDDEKILIQIDTVKQDYFYTSDKKLLDKFDVYKLINACPVDILLSKKIHALLARKRTKGRDIFDIVFLSKFTTPNFDYLSKKIQIHNRQELKRQLERFVKTVDLNDLARDVQPFLINQDELMRVSGFEMFIQAL